MQQHVRQQVSRHEKSSKTEPQRPPRTGRAPKSLRRSKGPSPGQLMTTSIRSEPLNSVPRETPNREIKGLAAAGRA